MIVKCEICNKDILDNSQYINGKYYHNDCIEQIQQENARLKDKFKDLEEWLEAMASMYEDEYKDVDASKHYKCMLYKLKEK